MPSCDLCGKENSLGNAIVEGSMLCVCGDCAKFGNIVNIDRPKEKPVRHNSGQSFNSKRMNKGKNTFFSNQDLDDVETVVSDYSLRLKKARERKDLTQEKVAKAIAEKESVIHKMESGQMRPSIKLAKKLQQFFGINLLTKEVEEEYERPLDIAEGDLTIGDLIKFKKRRARHKEPKLV